MARVRFISVGVLVILIILGVAVSSVYAGKGGHGHDGKGGHGHDGNSEVILDQINDITAKYNGNHSGLMQVFSGEFGDTFYIIVKKKGFWSRSKYVYKGQIDSQGYVTIKKVKKIKKIKKKCKRNICITTTKDDFNDAYGYLMANSKDYIMLDDVFGLSTDLWKTWFLNAGLLDEILSWAQDEYLDDDPGGQ